MASTHTYGSRAIEDAITKLLTALRSIESLGDVRSRSKRQIREALTILAQPDQRDGLKADQKFDAYGKFLIKVKEVAGLRVAVLCAIALGKSLLARLGFDTRARLVEEIKKRAGALDSTTLERLLDESGLLQVDSVRDKG